ncbi:MULTISPECIES: ABC transporter permease [unclassified Bartonella]|uniref:ABC transporter permease n=1 Tax=unclassified Bartonella TaxID=2645622 RepID=UPI0021CA4A2C|nr:MULTISPECIES: ABC transporter permease [unclassified Bartonella]UXN03530.1 ABC transporter permease [Bartonella sp. HY406]UXN06497.1 ABC transporter permease [Bartonella sp. HY761]
MFDRLWKLRKSQEFWLAIVIIIFVVVLSILRPNFTSLQNIMDLLSSFSYMGILVAALLVVLIAGGIDISFAAVATVAQYVALTIANNYGIGWLGVTLIACAVGLSLGVINGILVSTLRIPSIIVTIATQSVIFGLLLTITKGQDIFMLPEWFTNGVDLVFYTDNDGMEYAINLQIIALVLTLAVTWILLNKTNIGRQIYAFGSNPDAAQRVGFNVFRLNLFVYGYMGFAAGIASLVLAQYTQSVSPTALVGKELDVIAAAFLGGASVTGGAGTVGGAVLGIALIAIMENGLTLLGVSSYWSQFFTGLVIIAAVISMARDARRRWREAPGVA